MALFRNTDGALFAGLGDELGRKAEVLAHAVGEGVVAAGTREVFAVATDGQWRVWPWEQISGGSWKADTSRFVWKTMEGEKLEVTLEQANRLPQLFRERVEASTVVQALIDAPGRGEVQLIARRSLGAEPVNAGRKLTPCCRSNIDPSHGCWFYLVGWRRWPRVR